MQFNFNARTVEPAKAFDPLPAGWYTAAITASEMKPTKDNAGAYLYLEMKISAPAASAGRMIFDRLNLNNTNAQAVEIAFKTLSAICHATNVLDVTDTTQLHAKPMEVKVTVSPGEGNYGPRNEIGGYRALSGTATVATVPGAAAPWAQPAAAPVVGVTTAAAQVASAGAPPWAQPAASAAPVAANAAASAAPPWASATAPATPAPVAVATAPAPAPTFPPEGWLAHPDPKYPGWYYKGQEVKNEADLRALMAATPAPAPAPVAGAPPWARS